MSTRTNFCPKVVVVTILLANFITPGSSSISNLTVQPKRILAEQGRQQEVKVQFESQAPSASCKLYCDGKNVSDIEPYHRPNDIVTCSMLMTPKNVTQNCSITATAIFDIMYPESINFTVEKEVIVNRSAVYGQEGQDVEFGQIHAPYDLPLKCIFNITPNDRYQQTECSLKIQKTVADDVMEYPFNICLADSGDESCVSGSKSLNLFTPFLDTQSGNFSLTLKGKSAVDGIDVRCVRGCGSTNYSTLQNLTNKAIYSWEKAKYPIKIQIGNRMFDIDADRSEPGQDTETIVWASIGVVVFVIIMIIVAVAVVCYRKRHRREKLSETTKPIDRAIELEEETTKPIDQAIELEEVGGGEGQAMLGNGNA